jgi:adenine-specific DNA-methyltransferase
MDEIFGSENFVEIFCWTKTSTPPSLSKKSRKTVEYVLCFEKQKRAKRAYKGEDLEGGDQPLLNSGNTYAELIFPKEKVYFKKDKFPDGNYKPHKKDRVALLTEINIVNGYSTEDFILKGEFKWSQDFLNEEIDKGTTFIVKSDKFSIRFIRQEEDAFKAPNNFLKEQYVNPTINKKNQGVGTNENASSELKELVPDIHFDYPKPVALPEYLINLLNDKNCIVLDSFAGSGTTMHAVMELNKKDSGNRRCIMVQMRENNADNPEKNICKDITSVRVKTAIQKHCYGSGFKYLRVGSPIDPDTMLDGDLPTYQQFAEYVYYLATGGHLADKSKVDASNHFVGMESGQAVYLIYEQDMDKLTRLALTLQIAESIVKHSPGKRRVVFAPSCFLDEEYMAAMQIEFVSVPYNLFERKTHG